MLAPVFVFLIKASWLKTVENSAIKIQFESIQLQNTRCSPPNTWAPLDYAAAAVCFVLSSAAE